VNAEITGEIPSHRQRLGRPIGPSLRDGFANLDRT